MENTVTGLANPSCYAQVLCDCVPGMSREHFLSEGLLEMISWDDRRLGVKVQGLAFQKQGTIGEMAINGLASRILCERHNGLLSKFDTEGKNLFVALDAMNSAEGKVDAVPKDFRIVGDRIERWMLKTLLGCLYSGVMWAGDGELMKNELPPRLWIDHLYADAPIEHGIGLFVQPKEYRFAVDGSPFGVSMMPVISKDPGVTKSGIVCGIEMTMLAFQFTLMLWSLPVGISTPLDGAICRPSGLRALGNPQTISFDWHGDNPGSELVVRQDGTASGTKSM